MEIEIEVSHDDENLAAYFLGKIAQSLTDLKIAEPVEPNAGSDLKTRDGTLALIIAIIGGVAALAQLVSTIFDITAKRRAITKVKLKNGRTITIDPTAESEEQIIAKIKEASEC